MKLPRWMTLAPPYKGRLSDDGRSVEFDVAVDENVVLLRRLDRWTPGDPDTASLIGWAAVHLRGCVELAAVRPDSGGVFPDGTTNTPPLVWADTGMTEARPG